jgi:hypothetical protein
MTDTNDKPETFFEKAEREARERREKAAEDRKKQNEDVIKRWKIGRTKNGRA